MPARHRLTGIAGAKNWLPGGSHVQALDFFTPYPLARPFKIPAYVALVMVTLFPSGVVYMWGRFFSAGALAMMVSSDFSMVI